MWKVVSCKFILCDILPNFQYRFSIIFLVVSFRINAGETLIGGSAQKTVKLKRLNTTRIKPKGLKLYLTRQVKSSYWLDN